MARTLLRLAALMVVCGPATLASPPPAATADAQSHPTKLSFNSSSKSFRGGSVAAAGAVLPSAANPTVPGATGTTIVPGDHSTIAGDRAATLEQQMGFVGGGD